MKAEISSADRLVRVTALRKNRERSPFLRVSALLMGILLIWAWTTGGSLWGRLSAERRWANLERFVGGLAPAPVRKGGEWWEAFPWAWDLLVDKGFAALGMTLGIACSAIIIAGVVVTPFLPLASRKLGRPDPVGIWGGRETRWRRWFWKGSGAIARFGFVLARAIPEYILAFLLISLLGLQAWPLVLALAIHNFGILGRLWGEVVENADRSSMEQAIATGAGRYKAFGTIQLPEVFNRFLIYFFYRWETCAKDSVVLGMLGLLTLGHLIVLAKGFFWDQMFFYVLLGSSVILIGDFLSTWVRRWLRQ